MKKIFFVLSHCFLPFSFIPYSSEELEINSELPLDEEVQTFLSEPIEKSEDIKENKELTLDSTLTKKPTVSLSPRPTSSPTPTSTPIYEDLLQTGNEISIWFHLLLIICFFSLALFLITKKNT